MTLRERFEAYIGGPPYEAGVTRFPDNESRYGWPGQYRAIEVQMAWEAWQAARREALDEAYAVCDGLDHAWECAAAIRALADAPDAGARKEGEG